MAQADLPRGRDEWLWAAAGAMLLAAQVMLIVMTRGLTHANATTIAAVLPLILGLAIPTGLLLLAAPRLIRCEPTPLTWAALISAGLLMRAVWMGQTPPLEDDFLRYLWDGAVAAKGLDPYRYAPVEAIGGSAMPDAYRLLAVGRQPLLEGINFNDMRSIYPSVAQTAFAVAHLIAPFKVDGLRFVFLGGEIATFALLVRVLREMGRSPLWSVLYWWNPFAAYMTIGLVHVEAIIPPLVIAGLLMHGRDRPYMAVWLLGLAAGVKIWPLLLAPMVIAPLIRTPRRALVACLVLGATLSLAVGPLMWSTLRPGSGLSAYAGGWSNNNAFYAWMLVGMNTLLGSAEASERVLRLSLGAATAAIALAQAFRGDNSTGSIFSRGLIVAAAVFYLSPAQFPWYGIWFLPLAALLGSWPLLLASALLPFYYVFYADWVLDGGSVFFYRIAFIHSLPVLAWLLYDAISRARKRDRRGIEGTTGR